MNKQRGFAHIGILLVVLILAVVGFGGWYVWHNNKSDKKQNSNTQSAAPAVIQPTSLTGTVTKIDLSAMPTDGDGVYLIKTKDGSKTIDLGSGESSCDRTAILVPKNVHVGDDVSVVGKLTDGKYQICDAGTYIKLTQSYLYIKEWGIRFPLTKNLSTISYRTLLKPQGVSQDSNHLFDLKFNVLKSEPTCMNSDLSVAAVARLSKAEYQSALNSQVSETPRGLKLVAGYYYYIIPAQYGCTQNLKIANGVLADIRSDLSKASNKITTL